MRDPKFTYDCKNCKFNWNCGYACACIYDGKLPNPPKAIQLKVNKALVTEGYFPKFSTEGDNDNKLIK